jgi:hypothetical protein
LNSLFLCEISEQNSENVCFLQGMRSANFIGKQQTCFFFCPKHKSYTRPCIEFGFREYRGRVFPVEARALDDVLLLGWSVTCGRPEAETSVFLLHIISTRRNSLMFYLPILMLLFWCGVRPRFSIEEAVVC